MRYIRKCCRRFLGTRKKGPKLPLILLALTVFLTGAAASEIGLSSVSEELTREAARGYLLTCMQQAVNQELEERENSFVSVKQGESGQVVSVSANAAELNALKSGVLARLNRALNGKAGVSVPVGSLTGVALLNGRGFRVPIKLNFEGSADLAFDTGFDSAGLNQTCHRITMTLQAQAYSQSRRFETFVEASTTTTLAETVVVGAVPQVSLVSQ